MSLDMNVAVDVRRIQLALDELGTVTRDRVIPRVMAAALLSSTEQAFERQADPDTGKGWEAWSDSWQAWRQDHGFVPGSILTLHGDLARSITTDYGQDYALIGSPKIYAAIHQWGGTPDIRMWTARAARLIPPTSLSRTASAVCRSICWTAPAQSNR
ncbi:phage virion morphogenesis protein [Escherichia coli]|uniref:phage virion morphogenesis protein n=1 Tax=Escherichia coli TaxID=562 RepID=UPI003F57AD73